MIDITGDEAVITDFTTASLFAGPRAHHAVRELADDVKDAARTLVPVRRGQLRDSITAEMVDVLEAEVGPENALGGGYGHIVEKGLAGRPPQPFLSPALDESVHLIDRRFDGVFGDLV